MNKRTATRLQLGLIPFVRFDLRAVETLDLAVRQQDRRHSFSTQGGQILQHFAPEVGGDNRTFSISQVFGLILAVDLLPYQIVKPVERIDHHGLEVVLSLERSQCLLHILVAFGDREVIHLQPAQPVLGQDEDRVGGAGAEGCLAQPMRPVDHDAGRLQRGVATNCL